MERKNPLAHDSGQPIVIDGVSYVVEGSEGPNIALFNTLTGKTITLSYSAVFRRASLPEISLEDIVDRHATADKLKDVQKWKYGWLIQHVEEVAYGKPRREETYRPGYDPESSTQSERLDLKAQELAPLRIRGVSRSNLKKLVGKLKKQDVVGLMDGRSVRARDPFARIDPRLLSLMAWRVDTAKNKSTATTQQLITEVRVDWIAKYPAELALLPSDKTLRRKFALLTKGRYTTTSASNRRTNESSPKRYMEGRPAFAPGEEVQIDSTTLDVEVMDDKGKDFRPILTTFICKATHTILASMLSVSVKGIDLAYLLAKALSIPELRPGPLVPANLDELRPLPWAKALTETDLNGKDDRRPFIMPRRIIMDNGRDYQSDVFLAACRTFCIDATNAAPGTGSDKAIVERSHKTIKDLFSRNLPGFTGGNPDARGKGAPQEPKISIHTLAYILDLWIRHVWQNLETDALRNPEHPGRLYSPNTMYEALTYRAGCTYQPIPADTYISLLPWVDRVLTGLGIQLKKRRYDTRALDPYRKKPSGNKASGDLWRVHYDPNNPAMVWVKIPALAQFPDGGHYIECSWVNADAFISPFSRATREAAEHIARMGHQIPTAERSALSRQVVLGALAAAENESRTTERQKLAQRVAEEQGIGRPHVTRVIEPTEGSEVWNKLQGSSTAYALFDPIALIDEMDRRLSVGGRVRSTQTELPDPA